MFHMGIFALWILTYIIACKPYAPRRIYSPNWTCLTCVVLSLNYQQHPSFSEAVLALQFYDVMLWRASGIKDGDSGANMTDIMNATKDS